MINAQCTTLSKNAIMTLPTVKNAKSNTVVISQSITLYSSVNAVYEWMTRLKLNGHAFHDVAENFKAESIDGRVLLNLEKSELSNLGIFKLSRREAFYQHLLELRKHGINNGFDNHSTASVCRRFLIPRTTTVSTTTNQSNNATVTNSKSQSISKSNSANASVQGKASSNNTTRMVSVTPPPSLPLNKQPAMPNATMCSMLNPFPSIQNGQNGLNPNMISPPMRNLGMSPFPSLPNLSMMPSVPNLPQMQSMPNQLTPFQMPQMPPSVPNLNLPMPQSLQNLNVHNMRYNSSFGSLSTLDSNPNLSMNKVTQKMAREVKLSVASKMIMEAVQSMDDGQHGANDNYVPFPIPSPRRNDNQSGTTVPSTANTNDTSVSQWYPGPGQQQQDPSSFQPPPNGNGYLPDAQQQGLEYPVEPPIAPCYPKIIMTNATSVKFTGVFKSMNHLGLMFVVMSQSDVRAFNDLSDKYYAKRAQEHKKTKREFRTERRKRCNENSMRQKFYSKVPLFRCQRGWELDGARVPWNFLGTFCYDFEQQRIVSIAVMTVDAVINNVVPVRHRKTQMLDYLVWVTVPCSIKAIEYRNPDRNDLGWNCGPIQSFAITDNRSNQLAKNDASYLVRDVMFTADDKASCRIGDKVSCSLKLSSRTNAKCCDPNLRPIWCQVWNVRHREEEQMEQEQEEEHHHRHQGKQKQHHREQEQHHRGRSGDDRNEVCGPKSGNHRGDSSRNRLGSYA